MGLVRRLPKSFKQEKQHGIQKTFREINVGEVVGMSKLDDILYKEADIINSAQIKQQIKDLMLELIASEALGARFPSTMEHEKLRQVLRQKIEEL